MCARYLDECQCTSCVARDTYERYRLRDALSKALPFLLKVARTTQEAERVRLESLDAPGRDV